MILLSFITCQVFFSIIMILIMKKKQQKSSFSENLIRLRKEKGLSQRKLAVLSGLTQRMIGYYENEATKPPIDNIEAIAKALNVSISDLLGTNEITQLQNEFSQLDARTIRKIRLILSLPTDERHIVYSIAENFHAKRELQKLKTK